ncbi:MAG: SHOCT domain-containing protein [Chloroflexi bacterium]|nr:SHOCT domain-containing protein [Chloroflexota bacterium]
MMGPWMMGGVGGLGMIPMILFWGLIIWGIVWLARGSGGGGMSHSDHAEHHDSAMDILKSRYARGEINKQEFEDKKRDLI